jgi:chromosomal replication initiation ATPase DnaA
MAQQIPQWKLGKMHFDAHVVEWGMRHANPALAYLKDRCAELDILFRHIIGPGRRYAVVEIRHLLMWEIYEKFDLSLPQIGRLFGGRDHTTVLYAVNKIEARMSEARA